MQKKLKYKLNYSEICAEKEMKYTINPGRVGGRKTEIL